MHYYQHNIGDFDKNTRHLTRIERSVYRDLIELYYDTEFRLTLDLSRLCRRIIANSNEEVTAVEQVLNEFFTKTETGWLHDRCEEEIARYHAHISQRSVAGKKSAAARQEKRQRALKSRSTKDEQACNETQTNQEPITNISNTVVLDNKVSAKLDFSNWPQQPDPEILKAWLAMRKRVKASCSQLAINTIGNELHKAVANGFSVDYCLMQAEASAWKGFKSTWVKHEEQHHGYQNGSTSSRAARIEQWRQDTSRKLADEISQLEAEISQAGENGDGSYFPTV